MKADEYKTIASPSEGIYKEKGSKFLAYAFPISTIEEVKPLHEKLRKEHRTARHHCYAYRIGVESAEYRMNDDGEPSGTAGKPIYGQILSGEITNVVVFVVRYFGGTLLGTSGLIRSYKAATIDALEKARIVTKTLEEAFEVHFLYPQMNAVMHIVKEANLTIIKQDFNIECSMQLSVRKQHLERVADKLSKIENLKLFAN